MPSSILWGIYNDGRDVSDGDRQPTAGMFGPWNSEAIISRHLITGLSKCFKNEIETERDRRPAPSTLSE